MKKAATALWAGVAWAAMLSPAAVCLSAASIEDRLADIELQLEYATKSPYVKQDLLEAVRETGVVSIAERVEKKLDISNASLAEGNSLMREMTRRIEERDIKDREQDISIRENTERSMSNAEKIWAVSAVISFIFALFAVVIKVLFGTKKAVDSALKNSVNRPTIITASEWRSRRGKDDY